MSACLLCGSECAAALFPATDRQHRTTPRSFTILRCGQCGLMRLDPRRFGRVRTSNFRDDIGAIRPGPAECQE